MLDVVTDQPYLALGLFLLEPDSKLAHKLAEQLPNLPWFKKCEGSVTKHREPVPLSVLRMHALNIAKYREQMSDGRAADFLVSYGATEAFLIPTFQFCDPEMAKGCGEDQEDFLPLPDKSWLQLKIGDLINYYGVSFVVMQVDEEPGAVFLAPSECVASEK